MEEPERNVESENNGDCCWRGKASFFTAVLSSLLFLPTTAEVGYFTHTCEGELICRLTNENVPYFNAMIFLENKTKVGKLDEIFGAITDVVRKTHIFVRACRRRAINRCMPVSDRRMLMSPHSVFFFLVSAVVHC